MVNYVLFIYTIKCIISKYALTNVIHKSTKKSQDNVISSHPVELKRFTILKVF